VLGKFQKGLYAALALSCGGCVRDAPRASPAGPAPAGVSAVPVLAVDAGPAPAVTFQVNARGEQVLSLGAAALRVTLDGAGYDVGVNGVLDWVRGAARAVEGYYGVFPVPEALLFVHATGGRRVQGGHTEPGSVPRIDIQVGRHATLLELEHNWSLAHELVHLALPNLDRQHHWLEEGLASYVEPLARVRAGLLDEKDVWREWIDNLRLGLPEAGDRGLDHTPTWGRTYWGGALYCFLADLELRKRSQGRSELRVALRGILAAGGNLREDWPIARVLAVGDAATQTDVLRALYARMKDEPVHFDLPQIWRELGVSEQDGAIVYDDAAPLAELRKRFVRGG
jgi:hypothetical protein